jgi:hypothetical protein
LQSFQQSNPRAIDQLVAYLLQIDDSEAPFDPPSLAIDLIAPVENAQVRMGQAVALQINISATMGPVASVEYLANGQLVGTGLAPLYAHTWTPNTAGSYELIARLLYASGAATISTPRHLTVSP